MDDLISRLAAVDALEKEKPTPFINKDGSIDPFGAGRQNQWYRDGIAIMNLSPAQPAQQWIPFTTRPLTEEEKEEHPEWDSILDCKLPDDGQAILVSINVRGHERVQYDEFFTDDGSYLDSGYEIGTEATAWMPLPDPWKGEEE